MSYDDEMKIVINNLGALRLAQMVATKDVSRLYMCGVLFEVGGAIMATDGHTAMRCKKGYESQEQLPADIQIKFGKVIPKNWAYAILNLNTMVLNGYSKKGEPKGSISGQKIDARFPDVNQIMDMPFTPAGVPTFGINAEFLIKFQKALECYNLVMEMQASDQLIKVSNQYNPDVEYVVMPVRVPGKE